ncbi:hypothetical protein C9I57_26525 [Trinickia symbiotica]|uniref:Uncharacterized protein n=1 Tax=Trinickia symbiotica TaxID=863227 RepID=A0A2T3XMR2_9BURK|nr:hypothetical protein [Trinickia symbiotica]PTB17775.1 hypothetical protein C9I57_26525 [Trinickia symbiotica]
MQFLHNLSATLKRTAHRGRLPFLPGFNEDLPKFVATIDIDYVQRVTVGLEASHREHAIQVLQRAFNAGSLWNDSSAMPLLTHAFEPVHPDAPLQLASLEEVEELPPPDPSVATMRCISASHSLLRFARLIDALCSESGTPPDREFSSITVDVPVDELAQLRKLLRSLEAC